ncbi:3-deoxy-manno-octulosonate cytidylyltransferase [Acuticoccus mangrovi]|uniref:3-deoxy-manno-octulosonate cytidylyltransferase n=1 Tax=Acuticoccus mangrovi TaxID=2796142 RepID=A0A934IK34_9HYPH|nr:3-deoxy-manno-octulosonate cytidylyltransferase [Acuticoccus mangrovi]
MGVIIVIPARYESRRFPGKPLVELKGASGKARTLLQRTYDVGVQVGGVDDVIVATDDERIADHARAFGGKVVMTSRECRNGTERCAEVLAKLPAAPDLLVNLQGDAPLTPPHFVTALIDEIGDMAVATPVLRCDEETIGRFREDRANGTVGGTTAVMANDMRALYFSKEVIPYSDKAAADLPPIYHHVGLYAYTAAAIGRYTSFDVGTLETHEGLEQLRFLENGIPVRCVEVKDDNQLFWEVNNPIDVERVEQALAKRGIE